MIIGPIMVTLGLANGWMWQRMVAGSFLMTLVLFGIAVASAVRPRFLHPAAERA